MCVIGTKILFSTLILGLILVTLWHGDRLVNQSSCFIEERCAYHKEMHVGLVTVTSNHKIYEVSSRHSSSCCVSS